MSYIVPEWEGECAFCDETYYGGTVAFRGDGVVEQTLAMDLCQTHWKKFWTDFTRAGWVPHDDSKLRLCRLYEENGFSMDVAGQTKSINDYTPNEEHDDFSDWVD